MKHINENKQLENLTVSKMKEKSNNLINFDEQIKLVKNETQGFIKEKNNYLI